MGVLSDIKICEYADKGMINPFTPEQVRRSAKLDMFGFAKGKTQRVISYGVTSYGYDAILSPHFKLFTPIHPDGVLSVMDPKDPDPRCFVDVTTDALILPPHTYALGHTVETFDIPKDVLAICLGKSTYARTGLMINVTPLEPGWRGQVTLEFYNALPIPTKVYADEGICQFVFLRGEGPCKTTYADRDGKYMDQKGVVIAKA